MLEESVYVQLAARLALFGGILALGVALGAALGLQELQALCIQIGALPAPGTPVTPEMLRALPCYQSATTLQQVSNTAGGVGAALLLAGGVLDRYETRVTDAVLGVAG